MHNVYDVAVIGAGLGGLTAASLLAQHGSTVLLLEAHSNVGGCASYFARKKFLFDVGATTLSGMQQGQPVFELLRKLELEIPMKRCDPGMIIHGPGFSLQRWNSHEKWISELKSQFSMPGLEKFWSDIESISRSAWRHAMKMKGFPPNSFRDLASLVSSGSIRALPLLPALFRSVQSAMQKHGLADDPRLCSLIDEQLMITAQSKAHDAPLLTGALGLTYSTDTWYVYGGLNSLSRALQKYFTGHGGKLLTRKKVRTVSNQHPYNITCEDGTEYRANRVISNINGWNASDVFSENAGYYKRYYDSKRSYSAFTLYIGITNQCDDHGSLFHQIILDSPLPYGGGRSLFLSFSPINDILRAPSGYRTLSVSTHVENPEEWFMISDEEYHRRKNLMQEEILQRIAKVFPGFLEMEMPVLMSGSPRTFEHFTFRKHGMVGGIPHSVRHPLPLWRGSSTNQTHQYNVGDTVFPGQGAPGVILSAMHAVERIV